MIRSFAILAALVVAVTGCAPYQPRVEITTGLRSVNGAYRGMVNCLGVSQKFTDHVSVKWAEHCSNASDGSPRNDRYDVSHDIAAGIVIGWGGNPR